MHTKKKRTLAFIICMAFIVTALFSILFIVKEANHNCTGDKCPICSCIHQAEQTLKQLGTGATAKVLSDNDSFFIITPLFLFILFIPCTSLISQKVRLND